MHLLSCVSQASTALSKHWVGVEPLPGFLEPQPCLRYSYPPPPPNNNALVRTTRGVVSATFGPSEFGGSIFWFSMKIKFVSMIWGWGWCVGDANACPATFGCLGVQVRVLCLPRVRETNTLV